jgi:hypothetical protein
MVFAEFLALKIEEQACGLCCLAKTARFIGPNDLAAQSIGFAAAALARLAAAKPKD